MIDKLLCTVWIFSVASLSGAGALGFSGGILNRHFRERHWEPEPFSIGVGVFLLVIAWLIFLVGKRRFLQ